MKYRHMGHRDRIAHFVRKNARVAEILTNEEINADIDTLFGSDTFVILEERDGALIGWIAPGNEEHNINYWLGKLDALMYKWGEFIGTKCSRFNFNVG